MNPSATLINGDSKTAAIPWLGGVGTVGARGALGGGTITLQWCEKPSATDADWFNVTKGDGSTVTFSTSGAALSITLGVGYVRGVMLGSTTPAAELVISAALGAALKD